MLVGKVIGSIVSTRKNENLIGSKFMIVEPLSVMGGNVERIVAVDNVGAGIGEIVATHVIPRPHADVEKILPAIK